MLSQKFLSQLYEPVHATGSLKDTCTGDSCDYDVDNIRGRRPRLHAEAKDKDSKPEARNGTQSQAAVPGAHIKGCKNDQQLYYH